MKVVSVILPCYNEANNICLLVRELLSQLSGSFVPEIVVVDDASPDGTAERVRAEFSNHPNVKLICRTSNPGLAVSIRCGLENAKGDILVVMDTDFNHNPADVPLMCAIAEQPTVDMVLGSRFLFGGASTNRSRYGLSYIYTLFINFVLRTNISDNLSGFFAIKKDKLNALDFNKIFWGYGDYYFRLLTLTQKLHYSHIQIPIKYGMRMSGQSKTRFMKIFLRYTREVLRISYYKWIGNM